MRAFLFLLFISLGIVNVSKAQNSAEYYLRRCPYLSPNMEKMIGVNVDDDVFKKNLSKIIKDSTEHSITINTSKVSSLSVNVLRMVNNSDVVVVLFNVEYPTKKSIIRFFNKDMVSLPGDMMIDPLDLKSQINNLSCSLNTKRRIMQLISPLHIYYKFKDEGLDAQVILPITIEDEKNPELLRNIDGIKNHTYVWNSFKYIQKNKT